MDAPPAHDPGPCQFAVIGGGAMATAILRGAEAAGVLDPRATIVADPSEDARRAHERAGCATVASAGEAAARLTAGGAVMLAVKPQMLGAVAEDLRAAGADFSDRLVVSVLAGATSESVREAMPGSPRVVRVMPNTPAQIGRGISAIAPGAGATADDAAFVERLFKAVGETVRLDESMIDAFTGVAGSGPAYIFYLAEAMTKGALEVGFDDATADRIVRATIAGAAELLAQRTDVSASQLRAQVTSKKGTTQAATDALDRAGVMASVAGAIVAARDRGRDLAQGKA